MYERMPTGLAAEGVRFLGKGDDFAARGGMEWNILRPETVESLWVLHEVTGDPKYRAWGATIFGAFEARCRTTHGYGAHPDVRDPARPCCRGNDDKEESFWFAETLKYLYLLQDPAHTLGLDRYVMTTEAHPILIAA
jgi:mannosyl-oligosaccharide alpha-1,2-mannosidase